jgi:hypothetical protein
MTGSEHTTAMQSYLGNRWLLLVMATVAIVGGVALNWGWLVAAGIAPILLSLLPCVVMCGLGLCAHKLISRSGASHPAQSLSDTPSCSGADEKVTRDQLPKRRE